MEPVDEEDDRVSPGPPRDPLLSFFRRFATDDCHNNGEGKGMKLACGRAAGEPRMGYFWIRNK